MSKKKKSKKTAGNVVVSRGPKDRRVVKQRQEKKLTYLSADQYRALIQAIEIFGYDTDNDGQIVIYTDHVFDEKDRVVAADWPSEDEE